MGGMQTFVALWSLHANKLHWKRHAFMKISEVIGHIRKAENITFIIGAGASHSAGIPTAPELVKKIETDFSHYLTTLSSTDRKQYGKVMGALSPADRKRLIEPLLESERMNWGHIALANVIKTTEVRRILSFNFDFLLERAMSLLGSHLPVYDFGVAPSRHITGLADKAIFHLHGQSYGLTLLNTEKETQDHAEKLKPLISDSLRNHLTIVIGYSGEADAAFDIMKRSFDSNNNLIWLGYDAEPASHLSPLLKMNYADYIGNCDFDLTMLEIAQGVGSWPIPIIDNPPAHLQKLLRPLPDFPVAEENQTAILTQTRIRLEKIAKEWDDERTDEEKAAKKLMSGEIDENDHANNEASDEARAIRGWGYISQASKLVV